MSRTDGAALSVRDQCAMPLLATTYDFGCLIRALVPYRRTPLASGQFKMANAGLVVSCLFSSYFLVFLILSGYWGKAIMTGILGSLIFSLILFITSLIVRAKPWRTFWIANAALIFVLGGMELYAALMLVNSHATRFGGARLWIDGHITPSGFASIALDIAILTLSNFVGFYLSRIISERLNLE